MWREYHAQQGDRVRAVGVIPGRSARFMSCTPATSTGFAFDHARNIEMIVVVCSAEVARSGTDPRRWTVMILRELLWRSSRRRTSRRSACCCWSWCCICPRPDFHPA